MGGGCRGGLKYLTGRTCMLLGRRSGIRYNNWLLVVGYFGRTTILMKIVLGGKRESEPSSTPRCAANIQCEP